MADLIDRQAVQEMVDRIGGMYPYRQIGNRDSYSQYNEVWTDAINRVDAELNSLPSAQPGKRTEERTETHTCDCISRKAAIDALKDRYYKYDRFAKLEELVWAIEKLPTAQPDLCDGCDRYGVSCVGEGCEKLEMSEVAKDINVPINDCISRQALCEYALNQKDKSVTPNDIMRFPSAQPEEASMILGTSKDGVRLWYQCSVCGEPANADDNYCCNCGRKFING